MLEDNKNSKMVRIKEVEYHGDRDIDREKEKEGKIEERTSKYM
jgi:hypothetical protein